MRFYLIIIICLLAPFYVGAQKPDTVIIIKKNSPLHSQYKLKQAKVGVGYDFLTDQEKEIVQWLNIARMYPKWFLQYLKIKDIDPVYTRTLINTMRAMLPIKQKLVPDKKLWQTAYCHASTAGPLGFVGHERQNAKCKMTMKAECIYYGRGDPMAAIKRLLIDKGVPSLGHRKSMLNRHYTKIGVSIQAFKKDSSQQIIVIDFGY